MQEGNGIALLELIHAQRPNVPVIMVTAIHDISVAIDSMRRGAYDYLLKPFEREHLVATVQRALDHRQAIQESHTYQQNLEQVSAPGLKCSARPWKTWSTPTTSPWKRWATPLT